MKEILKPGSEDLGGVKSKFCDSIKAAVKLFNVSIKNHIIYVDIFIFEQKRLKCQKLSGGFWMKQGLPFLLNF